MRRSFWLTLIAALAVHASVAAAAEDYPVRPVRIIVAAGPGGGDDFTARQLAAKLSELLGQPFIVENRPGAGGMIGQSSVAKSPPDGYTLLLAGGSMAGARYVNANMGYDLLKDFTPISLVETSPFVLVINSNLPARDVKEFIALARSRPGKMTYATIGAGQIPYWSVVLFNYVAKIDALEVPYKGPAEAMLDVITGRVDYYFTPVGRRRDERGEAARARRDDPRALQHAARRADDGRGGHAGLRDAGMAQHHGAGGNAPRGRAHAQPHDRPGSRTEDLRERFLKAGSVPQASSPEDLEEALRALDRDLRQDRQGSRHQAALKIGV